MDSQPVFIIDAHLDLAMNALEWNRELTWPVHEIREAEKGMADKPDRGKGTVSLDAMRQGRVGLCVATLIARYVKRGNSLPGWKSPEQAWAMTQAQLAWYKAMEEKGQMAAVTDKASLRKTLKAWENPTENTPVGYVLSLEGADSILSLKHLERNHAQGLRAVGPAHYGPGTYAQGTDATGGIGRKGRELLKEMERLDIILDATHLCDESFWEALDHFNGPVWASHSNCRALVNHNRQFTDDQFRALIDRGAVIGVPLDAWMMVPGWERGVSDPAAMGVTLATMAGHIDHICQLAGSAAHVAIGTDLDGAFGREQSPADLDTIADLQKLPAVLAARGYSQTDIAGIMHGNWIAFLEGVW